MFIVVTVVVMMRLVWPHKLGVLRSNCLEKFIHNVLQTLMLWTHTICANDYIYVLQLLLILLLYCL